ncbi:MAG: hypothetical protein M1816_005854 [Peltula sp. TS41687]|nr:MAG: hypothetical protein M1816_005854 [Peltula sp. TS41687]
MRTLLLLPIAWASTVWATAIRPIPNGDALKILAKRDPGCLERFGGYGGCKYLSTMSWFPMNFDECARTYDSLRTCKTPPGPPPPPMQLSIRISKDGDVASASGPGFVTATTGNTANADQKGNSASTSEKPKDESSSKDGKTPSVVVDTVDTPRTASSSSSKDDKDKPPSVQVDTVPSQPSQDQTDSSSSRRSGSSGDTLDSILSSLGQQSSYPSTAGMDPAMVEALMRERYGADYTLGSARSGYPIGDYGIDPSAPDPATSDWMARAGQTRSHRMSESRPTAPQGPRYVVSGKAGGVSAGKGYVISGQAPH